LKKHTTKKAAPISKLESFQEVYHAQNKRAILVISAFMLIFGLLGMLWAVPFPHLKWLGNYNGYLNWASFFIAIAGYYYYRLSPLTGYVLILLFFGFSYVITRLQGWEAVGGPSLMLISSVLIAVSLLIALTINKRMWDKVSFTSAIVYFMVSPSWFIAKLFKKSAVNK